MALAGVNHWRRALMVMGIVIFMVSLMGGVLVAVVGSGGSLAVAASTTSTSSHSSGANSGKVSAAVKAQAQKALIELSDFPSGWVSGTTTASASRTSPFSKKLATCAGIPSALAAIKPTKISSPDYTSADRTLAVEDSISVYPTAAQAKAAYKAMANAKTPNCMNRIGSQALRSSVQAEAGSGATVGAVQHRGPRSGDLRGEPDRL